ncbi:transmembrane amino acid transporter protein-domain-containing protein [Aspergillus caelatus]|uniref:Transmembrane amino acid transporter protein-domain-containing protein n=1 Tax=Aspergillus caelatus TaxID=61420 RepID=A0A5N7AHI4_9EURO|nr:transmembrane amino acid transporter protein-domain-containing protein [Aspergillus caelatus]KAE8368120.1 transmembrane amino acid transporter protein-domain-containing protein [Aspergillus caelatus]
MQKKDAEKCNMLSPDDSDDVVAVELNDVDRHVFEHGVGRFNRLGWKRLTIVLLVEAVALGCLSLPSTFGALGMVPGTLCCVGLGCIAVYTSHTIGRVKLKFPEVAHYADVGQLMWGRAGYEVIYVMLTLMLLFILGSHCLTGTIAFVQITKSDICSIVFTVVSGIILLLLAIPPTFTEVAILGYIDFASIVLAVGITIIGTGVRRSQVSTEWSAWPREDLTFTEAFVAASNIVFAYSFAICQFSFMDEMHTPKDYVKSIWVLGILEILIYTLTGSLVYVFVGKDVKSPALLSAGDLLSRIAFGVALPVVYISGSINTTVLARMIHGRLYRNSEIRFINTRMGWITWLSLITIITVIAFIISEIIPFFPDLLSICSALFISGFTFYFPALMWFLLLREGKWNTAYNIFYGVVNACIFAIGVITLGCGSYASVQDIIQNYQTGAVRGVFACSTPA